MSLGVCSKTGGCQSQQRTVTMDANWRWSHSLQGYDNCFTGSSWDQTKCPDNMSCARNCAIDGIDQGDLKNTYGVEADGRNLKMSLVTYGQYSKNVGSRMFMLNSDDKYEMFKLKNKEFTFDVDVS